MLHATYNTCTSQHAKITRLPLLLYEAHSQSACAIYTGRVQTFSHCTQLQECLYKLFCMLQRKPELTAVHQIHYCVNWLNNSFKWILTPNNNIVRQERKLAEFHNYWPVSQMLMMSYHCLWLASGSVIIINDIFICCFKKSSLIFTLMLQHIRNFLRLCALQKI